MQPTFETIYLEFAQDLETQSITTLGRPLTLQEQAGIHNAGSLMMLESVAGSIDHCQDPQQLAQVLCENGCAFEHRRLEYCTQSIAALQKKVGRMLEDVEVKRVLQCPLMTHLMQILISPAELLGAASILSCSSQKNHVK